MRHYGIGPLTATSIVAELGDVSRLAASRKAVIRHGRLIRREVVAHGCSRVPFRERTAAFPKRLNATASVQRDTERVAAGAGR
jgi:hypothetical protein